jgi:hypothetical protein
MVEAQRIDFAEWAEGNRRVCKEILTKTEPYQAGERTNSIQRRRGMWVRRVENPWSVRDIEWKCILCYRFRSKHGAGWGWYGAGHGMERGLVCPDCKFSFPNNNNMNPLETYLKTQGVWDPETTPHVVEHVSRFLARSRDQWMCSICLEDGGYDMPTATEPCGCDRSYCEPCHKRLNGVCLCGEVLPRDFWYEG